MTALFEFTNGVYSGLDDSFVEDTSMADVVEFDEPFPLRLCDSAWDEISTPKMDCMLRRQKFTDQERFWFYAMVGNWLLGNRGAWPSVCPFFLGGAGTGKSTLIDYISKMYPDKFIGRLGRDGKYEPFQYMRWINPEVVPDQPWTPVVGPILFAGNIIPDHWDKDRLVIFHFNHLPTHSRISDSQTAPFIIKAFRAYHQACSEKKTPPREIPENNP